MGREVQRRTTVMGDVYVVTEIAKEGRRCYVSHLHDAYGNKRLVCHGTPMLWVAKDYISYVNAAQEDALGGRNPYVTRAYAIAYKERQMNMVKDRGTSS